MKRLKLLFALALPAVVVVACEQTPSGPLAVLKPSFLVVPTPAIERATVCKAYTGTVVTDSFAFTGVNTNLVGSPFRVAAESCRDVAIKGGDTIRATVTESALPAGVQLDSVVTYQRNNALGTTVHTNLGAVTTGSVYFGGNPVSGGVIVFYNSDTAAPVGQGCTPGYWKNHASSWAATGYTTSQSLSSVFALGPFASSLGSTSLLAALSFEGGRTTTHKAQILLRAAVAALLSSAHPGVDEYPSTTAEVIAAVNAALATNNASTILALASDLDSDNNLGCPLN